MIRTYKFRAFRPKEGEEDFNFAVDLKKKMWSDLCEMEKEISEIRKPLRAVPKAERDTEALQELKKERTAKIADIRRKYAAQGLAWGDYNAVVFQFNGACQSAAKRGALPEYRDDNMGECVVRQIMGGTKAHHLITREDVFIEYLPPNEKEKKRLKTGRRGDYRTARMTFLIRGKRNPLGETRMSLDFVVHRPLPMDGSVVEIRILKGAQTVINKNGQIYTRPTWHVLFVLRMDKPENKSTKAAGVALTWKKDEDGGAGQAVVSDKDGIKKIGTQAIDIEEWEYLRTMSEDAENEEEEEKKRILNEISIKREKLFRRRNVYLRTLAKKIVKDHGVICVDGTYLSGKGAKNYTAPAIFRQELQRAAENAGCLFFKETIKEPDERKRAKKLRESGEKKLKEVDNLQEKQCLVA